MSGALYVYALIPAEAAASLPGDLTGVDGHPVQAIAGSEGEVGGSVAALVHDAEPLPYQGADEAVRQWVLEHSRVVERAWEHAGTVLPVTFNVLVRGEGDESPRDRLRQWLDDQAPSATGALERLRGRVELRIEIAVDRASVAASDPEVEAARAEMASRPAGLRRLLEKKVEQLERQAADRLADDLYPEYRRRLAAHAEDLVEQRRARASEGTVAVLSVAVLASRDAVDALGRELAEIQEEQPGARVRFLGPWPPYSFAEQEAP